MTQGKSHTPENSTPECLFQCSENHWVKRTKNYPETQVTSQPRPEQKTFTQAQDSLRVVPWEHVHGGMEGSRGSPTDGTSCRGGGHHQPLGRVRAAVRFNSWSCPVGDGRRSHSEALQLPGKAAAGTVWGHSPCPFPLCIRKTE